MNTNGSARLFERTRLSISNISGAANIRPQLAVGISTTTKARSEGALDPEPVQLRVAIFSWKTRISTRRFLRRPLGVLLSATGLLAP